MNAYVKIAAVMGTIAVLSLLVFARMKDRGMQERQIPKHLLDRWDGLAANRCSHEADGSPLTRWPEPHKLDRSRAVNIA